MVETGRVSGTSGLERKDGSRIEFADVAGATVVAGMPVYVSVWNRVAGDFDDALPRVRDRWSAASTNSRNSGAGRVGRDLNSGWNCEATNHGWSGSSTISTSRPPGTSR